MDYIVLLVNKLSGGGGGNLYLSYDREIKLVFVATVVVLVVMLFMAKRKS